MLQKSYANHETLTSGLRAPSVRRKITYKSPVEVTSIIEILDDEPEPEPAPESEPITSENAGKSNNSVVHLIRQFHIVNHCR
jgi:hypothetical protein